MNENENENENENRSSSNFVRQIIEKDLESGKYTSIVTRFPPEPNGHLHLGHAKAICLNFSLPQTYGGVCHLRMDDTNPMTENEDHVQAIQEDVRWLGFDWGDKLFHASGHFQKLYELALELINKGLAYVCDLNEKEMSEYRGTLTVPGKNSPFRNRSIEENLDLFEKMKQGVFPDGHCVLRAKIDMSHANIKMRDPLMYRIRKAHHYRTHNQWVIYPMYDYAHGLSDAIEGVTHSLCTLEFENNRDLYDWFVQNTSVIAKPHQYEFARLSLTHTILSKRKLTQLVENKFVDGWDDPRMPTLGGMRNKGVPALALRNFCKNIGVSKANSTLDIELLDLEIRNVLNETAPRVMAVLDPLKVVITGYSQGLQKWSANLFPPEFNREGSLEIPFSQTIFIERSDFMENPPKDFHRLVLGGEVRLRHSYVIKCEKIMRDPKTNEIIELECSFDAKTLGAKPEGRKVKGVIHWVDASTAQKITVINTERFFQDPLPDWDFEKDGIEGIKKTINPNSFVRNEKAYITHGVQDLPFDHFQFERIGYFYYNKKYNGYIQTVSLKDSWSKK